MFGNKNDRLDYHDREIERLRDNIRLINRTIKVILKDTENKNIIELLGLY